jgi:hypothetical protein
MEMMNKTNCLQVIDALVGKMELVESNLTLTMRHHVKQQAEILLYRMDKIEMQINHLEHVIAFQHEMYGGTLNICERAIS